MGIGMNTSTPVCIKKLGEKYEARVGFILFGAGNLSEEEMDSAGRDPFSDKWQDNFCRGFGNTEEEALADLKKNYDELYESIWL